ncbi:MAG: ATP-binding protein [Cyanobacteria bacterium P01_A01_bin.15]
MTLTARSTVQQLLQKLIQNLIRWLFKPKPSLPEHQEWRDGLVRQRFWIGIGLAILYVSIAGIASYYEYFVNPDRVLWALEAIGVPEAFATLRRGFVIHKVLVAIAIFSLILLWRSPAIRRRPAIMLLLLPWGIAFIPEVVLGAYLEIPNSPGIIMFLAQALIIPVYWRLHLLAQLLPIAFYFLVYPLLGLTSFGEQSIYSFGYTVELILICIICELGVHLFETIKQSEIEANLRLQCCIHSITHDLRTPVMGSLLLLRSLQRNTPAQQPVNVSPANISALIHGSERLLNLMDTLKVPHQNSLSDKALRYQTADVRDILDPVLQDLREGFTKQSIRLENKIPADTPNVYVDICQTGRIFSNLIDNAVRHNPPGICITIVTEPVTINQCAMLKVVIADSGDGFSVAQHHSGFEPYVRGIKAKYQPGLGLGLYICKQIVEAHGGQIGIERTHGNGTAVWFTLPR